MILCLLAGVSIFGCKAPADVKADDLHSQTKFDSYSRMAVAVQSCDVKRIEIAQLSLERTGNGAKRVMDFAFNYSPAVRFSSLLGSTQLLVEQYSGGPDVSVGQYDTGLVSATINGQIYQGVLTTGNFDALAGSTANKKLVFTQPATPVAGVSSDYTALISALNSSGPGSSPRPNLGIPSDLKVLGFNSITFYLF